MKKILIITYFFPPCNLAGSYRLSSWARYLHHFGFYPIVITRHWNNDDSTYTSISNEKEITIKKFETYEVHYIPYDGNLRDKLLSKTGIHYNLITKFLSLIELILHHFMMIATPSKGLYYYAKNILSNDSNISLLLISGRPFILFRFGYLLKKKNHNIQWIADYRDPWNTDWWYKNDIPIFLRKLESYSEKKWLSNAETFLTCSEKWKTDIQYYINKKGHVIYNGYEDSDKQYFDSHRSNTAEFTIVHNGSLYGIFSIEMFIEAIKKTINNGHIKIKVLFPGVENDTEEANRIRSAIQGYEQYFELSKRIPHTELIQKMTNAQLLVLFGTKKLGGWIPLKLFEYLASGIPILYCPDDEPIISEIIKQTNTGYTASSIADTIGILELQYSYWEKGINIILNPNRKAIECYSRMNQAKNLAEVLLSL